MKKYLVVFFMAFLVFACNKPAGELVGVGTNAVFKEANPYGMIFVPRGSFLMGPNDQSAIATVNDKSVHVTVDAFWMDETEITNNEYRQFVHWVRDSAALRLLVLGGRDEFRMRDRTQENQSAPAEVALLNWKAKIPWNSNDEEIKDILSELYFDNENSLSNSRDFDPSKLRYRYEIIDYDQAALPLNRYDVNTGSYREGARVRIDTSYVDENRVLHSETIIRPLRIRRDLISTRIVNIYPDTIMWIRDFQYAYNEPKMKMYFSHPGYAQYPVVGVTWEQATAFCNWRTDMFNSVNKIKGQQYRLPTEAEWEYAARGGRQLGLYPWGGNYVRDNRGCFLANFKPMRGSYTDDTGATTMKVGSFPPNDYGLYDMAGNASEWTSSAYYRASNSLVHDMNPTFQYNAKKDDLDLLKRKVVKGGSWKDIAYYLQCGVKTYEYQEESRPYIGFRCVRSFNGE
jgi:formylglycine-generating enzyme required for sulfatase activity